jgi:hypothetical protein
MGTQRSEQGFAADRGRIAETPTRIPPPGWKDILRRVYARITECRVVAVAAAVAGRGKQPQWIGASGTAAGGRGPLSGGVRRRAGSVRG